MRRFFALLFALLLPLQTLASFAMPIRGEQADGLALQQAMPGGHCTHEEQPAGQPPSGSACEHCGICHLACAGMIPATEAAAPCIRAGAAYATSAEPRFVSHTPEAPTPPPVSARS